MIDFEVTALKDMDSVSLYEALKLRSDVFVVEQTCVYPDLDNKDIAEQAMHVLGREQGQGVLAAYARCLPPGLSYQGSSIGRVVVGEAYRGQGIAQVLTRKAMDVCLAQWPDADIEIGAQLYLKAFYETLGFVKSSEPYDEDGIMHIDMKYRVDES